MIKKSLFREMMMQVNELGETNSSYPYTLKEKGRIADLISFVGNFTTDKDVYVVNMSYSIKEKTLTGGFTANNSYETTNSGNIFKVVSTVIKGIILDIKNILEERNMEVKHITFDSERKDVDSQEYSQRTKLYFMFFKRVFPNASISVENEGETEFVSINI